MLTSLNSVPTSNFNPALNFICEENPFGLAPPPTWFLEEMWKFDPLLVIFPSKEEALYRLARRVEHGQPILTLVADPQKRRPDTTLFWKHKLVPVTSILPSPWVHWGPCLLNDLARADIRRQGGAKRLSERLEAADDDAESRWHREVEDGATIRARASWREQKWTRGESLDLGGHKPEGARTTKKRKIHTLLRRAHRPGGIEGSSPVLFTGRDEPPQGARPFLDGDVDNRSTLTVRTV